VPITTKVEIQSVKTASWIVGSNPFGGDSNRLAGYIVHIACPRFVCKYTLDKDEDLYYCVEFDDRERAAAKFGGIHDTSPDLYNWTLTVFDLAWIDPKPKNSEEYEKLIGYIYAVIKAYFTDDLERKAELAREWID